MTTAIENVMNI